MLRRAPNNRQKQEEAATRPSLVVQLVAGLVAAARRAAGLARNVLALLAHVRLRAQGWGGACIGCF